MPIRLTCRVVVLESVNARAMRIAPGVHDGAGRRATGVLIEGIDEGRPHRRQTIHIRRHHLPQRTVGLPQGHAIECLDRVHALVIGDHPKDVWFLSSSHQGRKKSEQG